MNPSRVAVVRLVRPDGHAVHRLSQAFVSVTPAIEVIDEQQILLPMRGPTRYFGGESSVAARLCDVAATVHGEPVAVGIGASRLAAQVAAQSVSEKGVVAIISDDDHSAFLDAQPVAVLERFAHINPDTVSLLFRLGLGTLGAVAAVKRELLVDRFGPEGGDVHLLCAGGDLHEPYIEPLPTQCLVESHHDTPLDDAALVVGAAGELAGRVVDHLEPRGLVACRVVATFTTEHDETCSRIWYHPQGFVVGTLSERLRWQIEKWVGDHLSAGVAHISLDVQSTRPHRATQLGLWGEHGEADRAAWAAVGRLGSLLGDNVCVPEWRGGRDPMQQFVLVPAARVELRDADVVRQRITPGAVHPERWTGAIAGIVPPVCVTPRREVQVLDANDRAVTVTGRHVFSSPPVWVVDGVARKRIVACFGPWPVEERWWDTTRQRRVARMQCIVESVGASSRSALLLVLEKRSWWLSGVYG
jgi:protein ImuB